MSILELPAATRELKGRKVSALRREGFVPANIVSKGKESRMIQIPYLVAEKTLNVVGYTQPVELSLETEKVTVLVTDVTFAPAKNTLEHITFQEVKKGELVTANVPVRISGTAPGVQQGLLLLQIEDTIEIECGALSIPEYFDVDVAELNEEGDSVRAGTITLPENASLKTDPEATLVRLEAPRVEAEPDPSDESAEGDDAAGAEGDAAAPGEDKPAEG